MAHVGKALHRKLRDERLESPERERARIARRAACEQAVKEREARFPVLTPENAAEALAWQEQRIRELTAAVERQGGES